MLLLSSHSAKNVVIDVYWFSTKLDGGAVVDVLDIKHNNLFGRFSNLFTRFFAKLHWVKTYCISEFFEHFLVFIHLF